MKKQLFFLGAFVAALVLQGCGGGSDSTNSPTTTPNIINTALSTLKDVTPEFSPATAMVVQGGQLQPLAALGDDLTTANSFPDIENPGTQNATGFTYLGNLFGEEYDNSIFWRARTPFLISCTIDAMAAKSGALYDTTQTSITLASSIIGQCGTAQEFTGPGNTSLIGTSVTVTIENLATTTNYDQLIKMPGASNPQFGGNDQWIYVRNNDTTLNFMHVEIATDNSSFGVSTLHFEKATKSGYFQYVSTQSGGGSFVYRIYMDSTTDKSRMFTLWKMTGGGAHTILANVGTGYTSQTSAALSLSFTGLTGVGSGGALDNGNGCVQISNSPSLDPDGDSGLTCNGQTITAVGAITGHAVVTNVASLSASAIRTWADDAAQGAVKYPTFTDSTIQSAVTGL